MIQQLWRALFGYVVITIKGPRLERFLNRMAQSGILVWGTERLSTGMLVARVSVAGFKRARALCRRQGWKVNVAEKVGLPFVVRRMWERKLLVLGAALSLVSVYIAAGYIWFVQVEGDTNLPVARILAVAEEAGLKPGVRADRLDPHDVRLALLLSVDELAWAAVTVRGTLAVIHVAERTASLGDLARPGDIVAARGGIVEKVTVANGHPVVVEGATVSAGDILIGGFIPPEDPRHRVRLEEGRPPYVRADGIITARVWYEGSSRVLLNVHDAVPTGRRAFGFFARWGDRSFEYGAGKSRYEHVDARRFVWSGSVLGRVDAEFAFGVYREVELHPVAISEEEARQSARDAAAAQLEAILPEEARTEADVYFEVNVVDEHGTVAVEAVARAEVTQNIARFRPME